MPIARLEAVLRPDEVLRDAVSLRPILIVSPGTNAYTAIHLGRNSTTQIADATISRRLCSIYWTGDRMQTLTASVCKADTKFYVNGVLAPPAASVVFHAGDVIALGMRNGTAVYEYKVVMEDNNSATATAAVPAASLGLTETAAATPVRSPGRKRSAPTTSTTTTTTTIPPSATDEFYCALCLEIQVQSVTLVPCGHCFCGPCCGDATATTECPTCRTAVQSTVPCRALANAICSLAQMDTFFDDDDLAHYRERMAAAGVLPNQQQQQQQQAGAASLKSLRRRNKRPRGRFATPAAAGTTASTGATTGASVADAICIE
jgi:hypothetical protein